MTITENDKAVGRLCSFFLNGVDVSNRVISASEEEGWAVLLEADAPQVGDRPSMLRIRQDADGNRIITKQFGKVEIKPRKTSPAG